MEIGKRPGPAPTPAGFVNENKTGAWGAGPGYGQIGQADPTQTQLRIAHCRLPAKPLFPLRCSSSSIYQSISVGLRLEFEFNLWLPPRGRKPLKLEL